MNTRTPFDTGNSCCTANNDQIVDHLLVNAYQVVNFVVMQMPYIKTLSDNIDKLNALQAKLPELSNISTNLDAALSDNTAFKSATGSSKIGHTPTTGGATTVEAELKAIRTLAGYSIDNAFTKTETNTELGKKADKTGVVGGGGDPAAKTGRALATYVTSPATRPVQHSVLVAAVAGGAIRFVITCRKSSGQPEVVLGAYEFTASGAGNVVGASAVVPAGWEVKVDASNATLNSWTEF